MKATAILGLGAAALGLGALGAYAVFGAGVFTDPRAAYAHHVYSAGHKALFMCSGVFVAGRKPEDIRNWEIAYASDIFNAPGTAEPDYDTKSAVGTALFGFVKRRAAFREGLGCALMGPGAGVDDIADLPRADIPRAPGDALGIPWPDGDLVADAPPPPEVDRAKLDAAMDAIFDGKTYYNAGDAWMDDLQTIGVVIVYKGEIIAERYAPGWGVHTQMRTYSAAKSFTNAIAGVRVRQGALALDGPLGFPEWANPDDPRGKITLRQFLNMTSGLECDGGAGFSLPGYFSGGLDVGAQAAERKLVAEPGEAWCYANFDPISIARAVRLSLPTLEAYLEFPHREIFAKIGMRDTYPETDAFGNFIMSSQIWTTPRDLARFGLLYLNDGVWNGERILPEGWVEFTRAPAPARVTRTGENQAGYGAQFWLYNNHPRVPTDTFSAAGHAGQYSTIIPSHDLVIARMGLQNGDYQDFVADIVEAVSGGQ